MQTLKQSCNAIERFYKKISKHIDSLSSHHIDFLKENDITIETHPNSSKITVGGEGGKLILEYKNKDKFFFSAVFQEGKEKTEDILRAFSTERGGIVLASKLNSPKKGDSEGFTVIMLDKYDPASNKFKQILCETTFYNGEVVKNNPSDAKGVMNNFKTYTDRLTQSIGMSQKLSLPPIAELLQKHLAHITAR